MALELEPGVPIVPLTVERYDAMVARGVLTEDDRVELLAGVLVPVTPEGELHGDVLERLGDWAAEHVDRARFRVRVQQPVRLAPIDEPEPDVAVSERAAHALGHPCSAVLAVEVAVTSRRKDLGVKRRRYALAGIPVYLVVLPQDGLVRVHRAPAHGDYTDVRDAAAQLALPEVGASLDVRALLAGLPAGPPATPP